MNKETEKEEKGANNLQLNPVKVSTRHQFAPNKFQRNDLYFSRQQFKQVKRENAVYQILKSLDCSGKVNSTDF